MKSTSIKSLLGGSENYSLCPSLREGLRERKQKNTIFGTAFIQIFIILVGFYYANYANATSTYRTVTTGSGNPVHYLNPYGTYNNESDDATSGWTAIRNSANTSDFLASTSTNAWSGAVTLSSIDASDASHPFTFSLFGGTVSYFKVSGNGMLEFVPTTSSTPTDPSLTIDNADISSTTCTSATIAAFWDRFASYYKSTTSNGKTTYTVTNCSTGSNDKVYTKVFGTYPYRQVWIKWYDFKMGYYSTASSSDKCSSVPDQLYFAIVLEETTNRVMIVDMYKGTSSISSTIALKNGSASTYVQYSSTSNTLNSASKANSDNTYYLFTPYNSESYTAASTITFSSSELSSATSTSGSTKSTTLPSTTCLTKTISSAKLYVKFNTGDDYEKWPSSGSATSSYKSNVTIKITDNAGKYYSSSGQSSSATSQILTINETTPEQVYVINLTSYYSGITSLNVNASSFSNAWTGMSTPQVQAWVEESYSVDVNTAPYNVMPFVTLSTVAVANNVATFSWTPDCHYINDYQLQLLRLYNQNADVNGDGTNDYSTLNVKCTVDWTKALTIDVNGGATSLSLTLAQGSGYYAWRVRPIGTANSGGVGNSLNWGAWSDYTQLMDNEAYYTSSGGLPNYVFYYTQTDVDKNWIFARSFTENNLNAEKISFADGLQNVKQSQVHMQTDNKVIVTAPLYDFSGRNAGSILPTPISQDYLKYKSSFITASDGTFYNAKNFDDNSNYSSPSSIAGGDAVTYYNSSYSDQGVPSANGYPFTRVLYKNDGTNRPKEAGGAGSIYRIGGGNTDGVARTVTTVYSAVDAGELIPLFGDETPADTSVIKSTTTNQDKVTTISYNTLDGKTIATCLSGDGASTLSHFTNYSRQTISGSVSGNTQIDPNTIEGSKLVSFDQAQPLTISYNLTPSQFQAECGNYCYSCDYTIELYIKSDGSTTNLFSHSLTYNPTACASMSSASYPSYSTSVSIPSAGNYIIGKRITLNNTNASTGNQYLSEHLDNVASNVDNNNDANFSVLLDKIDAGDLDDVNTYLNTFATTSGQTEVTIPSASTSSCCSLTLPILNCDDQIGDFEALLFDTWSSKGFGYYLTNYFFNYATYTPTAGDKLYDDGVSCSPSYITFTGNDNTDNDCKITVYVNSVKIIDNVSIGNGKTGLGTYASNLKTVLESYQGSNYFPYNISKSGNSVGLEPNIDEGAQLTGYWMVMNNNGSENDHFYTNTSANSAESSGSFTDMITYDAANTAKIIGKAGMFNSLIANMAKSAADGGGGYDPNTLWQVWKQCVAAYPELQYENGDRTGTKKSFDLLQYFLTQVGREIGGVSSNDDTYRMYAYKYICIGDWIACTTTTYASCATEFGIDASGKATAATSAGGGLLIQGADQLTEDYSTKYWEQFYNCILGQEDFSSTDEVQNALGWAGLSCSAADVTCINSMVQLLEDSCTTYCDYRNFDQLIRDLYAQNNVTATEKQIWCLGYIMREKCETDCQLTVTTATSGSTTYVSQVGTDDEKTKFQRVFTGYPEVEIAGTTACTGDYTTVTETKYYQDELTEELNEWLADTISSASSLPFNLDKTDIQTEINAIYAEHSSQWEGKSPCDITGTAASYKMNTNSVFYLSGTKLQLYTYVSSSSTYTYKDVISNITSCSGSYSCTVCYRWTDFPTLTPDVTTTLKTCEQTNLEYLRNLVNAQLASCKQQQLNDATIAYQSSCEKISAIHDAYTYSYTQGTHFYTLYYYDRVGNLVKTVPPKGVVTVSSRTQHPAHTFVTTYDYNSLGQMVSTTTPDGGTKNVSYNSVGLVRFSQDAQQTTDGTFTYIKHDAFGRIIECGKGHATDFASHVDDESYPSLGTEEEKTFTYYTTASSDGIYTDGTTTSSQRYLLNRVSYTKAENQSGTTDDVYTYYSYDPHGNVEWLIQNLPDIGKQYIRFEYDLISNKVTKVIYNEGQGDQFRHWYQYDDDNRLISAKTSRDGVIWDTDALYSYYAHGPLKRSQLGEDKVQGLDYVYTLNGWLKAINNPAMSASTDPGYDGNTSGTTTNQKVAKDAFAEILNYHTYDFVHTGSPFEYASANTNTMSIAYSGDFKSYYSGLISDQIWNTSTISGVTSTTYYKNTTPLTAQYSYDDIGRLISSSLKYFTSGSGYTAVASSGYSETFSYDDNGNILTASRYGSASKGKMDGLTYSYPSTTNRLSYIDDNVSSSTYDTDLDDQSSGNYSYDNAGRLTKDTQNGLTSITWYANGKVKTASRSDKTINFYYDALGNRIMKKVHPTSGSDSKYYYLKDASGGQLVMYSNTDGANTYLSECSINGTERLGMYKPSSVLYTTAATSSVFSRTVNSKYYELKDHLGNARVVITDVKTASSSVFTANIYAATDHYAFGATMPLRTVTPTSNYRYGFQDKEKDDELKGNNNSYDFDARIYDPLVGRWLSGDPLENKYPSLSTYNFCNNNPVMYVDHTGKSWVLGAMLWNYVAQGLDPTTPPAVNADGSPNVVGLVSGAVTGTAGGLIIMGGGEIGLAYLGYGGDLIAGNSLAAAGGGLLTGEDNFNIGLSSGSQVEAAVANVVEEVASSSNSNTIIVQPGDGTLATANRVNPTAANAPHTNPAKGWDPPYDTNSEVWDITLKKDVTLPRGTEPGNPTTGARPTGAWLADPDEVAGKSGAELQQGLATNRAPTHIVPVTVPAGATLRTGVAAARPAVNAPGGMTQYELPNGQVGAGATVGTPQPIK